MPGRPQLTLPSTQRPAGAHTLRDMKHPRLLLPLLWLLLAGLPAGAETAPADWVPPLEVVTVRRAFDPPEERWGAGHRGVDLAGSVGAPVRAAGDGEVVFAGELAGRGVVSVRHGDLRTTYEPVEPVVAVGALVSRGDVLGRLEPGHGGAGPVLDAAVLHWGLLRGETYLDPLSLLSPARVRLLPRWHLPAAPTVPLREPGARPLPAPGSVERRGDASTEQTGPVRAAAVVGGLAGAAGVGFLLRGR